MNILITGANGQLGHALKDTVNKLNINHNFIYTDYDTLDITDDNTVNEFLKNNNISVLINCAAYTNVNNAEKNKDTAFKLNAKSLDILGKYCNKYNIKLIHISSDYIYTGHYYKPYKEFERTENINSIKSVYGQSKLFGEILLKNNMNTNYFIVRISWLYYTLEFNNFVSNMKKLMETHNELNVVFDQVGTPTNAKDLAEFILTKLIDSKNFGTYNFSNEGVCSWYDFAKEINSLFKLEDKCKIIPVTSKEFFNTDNIRPYYSVMDKSSVKNKFNIEIPHWKDSLKNMFSK